MGCKKAKADRGVWSASGQYHAPVRIRTYQNPETGVTYQRCGGGKRIVKKKIESI